MTQISVDHNQRATFERATGNPAPANQKFKLTQCIGIPKDEMIIEPYIASAGVHKGDYFLRGISAHIRCDDSECVCTLCQSILPV